MAKLLKNKRRTKPGASPGTLVLPAGAKPPKIRVMCYSQETLEERELPRASDCREYLKRKDCVCWFDVRGLGNEAVLRELGTIFNIHPLALEDVVHTHQRPKAEEYDGQMYVVTRLVTMRAPDDMNAEQLSIFLGKGYVLTFQDEAATDVLEPVRGRLRRRGGIHRRSGADYLCYSIIDTVIDQYFPALEQYGEYLEALEERTVMTPVRQTLKEIHTAKRELLDLRRVIWPQRDMVNQIIRSDTALITPEVRIFLRDCYDHAVQVMDMIETYREITSGLHDVYLSALGQRTNEIMKVLTIISTIFIPLTFIAGVYGMNFDPEKSPWNMPELRAYYGYPVTMGVMFLIALSLVYYFWTKGWIFARPEPVKKEAPPPATTTRPPG